MELTKSKTLTQLVNQNEKAALCIYAIDSSTEPAGVFVDIDTADRIKLIEYVESLDSDEKLELAFHLLESCKKHTGPLIFSIPEAAVRTANNGGSSKLNQKVVGATDDDSVRMILLGHIQGVNSVIHHLHCLGFAHSSEWCKPRRVLHRPGNAMSVCTKRF